MPNLENPNSFAPWHHAREFLREVSACTIEIKRINKFGEQGIETFHGNGSRPLVHSAYLRGASKHLVIAWVDVPIGKGNKPSYVISNWFGPPTIEIQCMAEKKVKSKFMHGIFILVLINSVCLYTWIGFNIYSSFYRLRS